MKKRLLISSLLALTASLSFSTFAKSPDYDTLSVSYGATEFDDTDWELSGFSFSGTKLINDNVFVAGGYASASDDVEFCFFGCVEVELTLSELNLGVGYRHAMTSSTDIYAAVSYVKVDVELTNSGNSESNDENGHAIVFGLRSMLTDKVEA